MSQPDHPYSIGDMLRRGGPCKITLWVGEDSAQANVQEPGSSGWSCHTEATAEAALFNALAARPIFYKNMDVPRRMDTGKAPTRPATPPAAPPEPPQAPRRIVRAAAASKPAPVAPIRRVVRGG